MMTFEQAHKKLKGLVKHGSVQIYVSVADYRSCLVSHSDKTGNIINQFNCTTFEECFDMLKDSLTTKLTLVK